MTATVLAIEPTWESAGRYTASGDTDIMLSNSGGGLKRWTITADDTAPTITVAQGHPLLPLANLPMQLLDTERLWVAGGQGTATIEV